MLAAKDNGEFFAFNKWSDGFGELAEGIFGAVVYGINVDCVECVNADFEGFNPELVVK